MSRKKTKKKPETIQATLGEVLDKTKPKKGVRKSAKKDTSKKKPARKPKKTTTKKKTRAKKKTPPKKKPAAKKKVLAKKKPAETKKPVKKKTTKKKEVIQVPLIESAFSLKDLPGVGPKLAGKLMKAKYETVEKISRAMSKSLAK